MSARPVAIVTGAARGIGEAIARAFLAEGYAVTIADIDASAIHAKAAELSEAGEVLGVRADVTNSADIDSLITSTLETFGTIDVVVNNAGKNTYFDAISMTEDQWDDAMSVDLKSSWLVARAALPSLIESRGNIVNITSVHGRQTSAGMFPYAVAKSGLEGLTRSLAVDYGPRGVRVNAVAPGWTHTRLVDEWLERESDADALQKVADAHPLRRIAEPADVAAATVFLAGPGARAITGAVLPVDGGLTVQFRVD